MSRDVGVRRSFTAVMLAAGLAIAGVVYLLAGLYIDTILHEEFGANARLLAAVIVDQADQAATPAEIERTVNAIGGQREVLEAVCLAGTPPRAIGATRRHLVPADATLASDPALQAAFRDGQWHPFARLAAAPPVYEAVLPVTFRNQDLPGMLGTPGAVLLRLDAAPLLKRAQTSRLLMLGGAAGAVAVAILLFVLLAQHHLLRPIRRLRRTMARRRDGDLLARPERMPNPELQSMADSLAELLDAHDRMAALQRAVVEGASDAIVTIDERGTIRQWNGGAEEMFGVRARDAIGTNLARILPEEHRATHDGYVRRYLTTGLAHVLGFPREVQAVREDGSLFPVGLAVSEARVGDERLFVGILRDMTDEAAQRHELQQAKEAADAAAAAKATFLANMSHEIRTPLTAILGYAEELSDPELQPAMRQEAVEVIQHNGEHLMTIVNDILDLSKIEAGRMATERVPCRAEELAAEVVRLMLPRAQQKGLCLELRTTGPLPQSIASDPTRIRQILINLVGNAVKFTARGSVVLDLRADFAAETMRIDVVDTGIGIDDDALQRLFGSFVQADSSTTRHHGGTGLGLHISRRLARMLDGDLTVTTRPGQGSTFTLTLATGPIVPASLSSRPSTEARQRLAPPRLHGRVLLAEDGPDNVRLLRRILEPTGVTLTVVGNGAEALAAVQQASPPFDAVLMDMQMPVMDGVGATRAIRASGATMPIVALTANVMAEDLARAREAGCTHVATKPIDRPSFYATLQAVLAAAPPDQRATSRNDASTSD
ncbi:MAG: ATP-binding protein [Planctomycetota bacterium]